MPHLCAIGPLQWRTIVADRAALPAPRTQTVPTKDAVGLILAEPLIAARSAPEFPQSAMDGFAVRSRDGRPERRTVIADIPAGTAPAVQIPEGEQAPAVRIMTGAPVPEGFDVVIPVEATDASQVGPAPAAITISADASLTPGRHIRGVGEEIRRGTQLAPAGRRLSPTLLAVALAAGTAEVVVQEPWQVAVIMTGDELADTPSSGGDKKGTVLESNGPALAAALARLGCTADVQAVGDDPTVLRSAVRDAAQRSDLIITTGGVGSGAFDVVKAAFSDGTSRFEHLLMRPGGPQGVGRFGDVPMIHLPGTPVGATVGFHLFIRPLLETRPSGIELPAQQVRTEPDTKPGAHVKPAVLSYRAGALYAEEVRGRRLLPYASADAIMVTGLDSTGGALVVPLLTGD